MEKIQQVLTNVAVNIILLSGTLYLTDKWGFLQPILLVGGMLGISLVFTLTHMKLKLNIKNFILYTVFICCCLFSALVNEDKDLFVGAVLLYLMYLTLGVIYPAIDITNDFKYKSNQMIVYTYLITHLPIITLPILIGGVNRIPYKGIFYNPNSYGAISATIYAIILSRFSHLLDSLIIENKLKIVKILLNTSLLLITFTLTIISRSRTSFFAVLFITMFYLVKSLFYFISNCKINIAILIRTISILVIILSICSFIILKTGIFELLEYTIISKMIGKSDDLSSGRMAIWYRTVSESSLFGNGRDYFNIRGDSAYSTYISLLGQYGIIPTLVFCFFLLDLLYNSFIYIKRNKKDEYRYYPIYSIMMFLLLSVGEGMFFMDSMLLTYMAIGCVMNYSSETADISSGDGLSKVGKKGGATMEEIDLRYFLQVLKEKLHIIALITLICIGASGLISYYVIEPEYQTYTTLLIGRPRDYNQKMEYDDILLNQKLVSTYGEIAKSRVVANEFMTNLGLNYSYEELDKKINVTLVKDTEIIKILVKDKDGSIAAKMADEIANVFIKHIVKIMNIENVQIIDKAMVPLEPNKPKPVINMVIAAALGIILSIFSVIIHEYLDNTVKTNEDIEKNLGLPIIGIVPKII